MGQVYRARDTKLDRDVALPKTQRHADVRRGIPAVPLGHDRTFAGVRGSVALAVAE